MKDMLVGVVVAVGYLLLVRFVLPKLGIQT
jgi:hypothetical protein